MKMNDMMVISVDDHVSEPPDMFDKHLSGADLASAPKLKTTVKGTNYWDYQGLKLPSVGLTSCVVDASSLKPESGCSGPPRPFKAYASSRGTEGQR